MYTGVAVEKKICIHDMALDATLIMTPMHFLFVEQVAVSHVGAIRIGITVRL